jgi:hypothetical protein
LAAWTDTGLRSRRHGILLAAFSSDPEEKKKNFLTITFSAPSNSLEIVTVLGRSQQS